MYAEPKIIDRKFSPVIKTYYVSELTTDNNAIAAGTTQWQDVWTLTSGSLRINNIAPTFLGSYTLRISQAFHSSFRLITPTARWRRMQVR